MYNEINSYELKELLQHSNLNLIDIRDKYSYSKGTIKNAINISSNELLINHYNYLDKNKKYYIFCNHGSTSKDICMYLANIGYDVVTVAGGYNSYSKDSKF